jgi:hypothetical protein
LGSEAPSTFFLRPPSLHAPTPPSHAVMSRCAAVLGRGEGSQGPLGLGWEMGWLITAGACCCCCASQGLTIVHRPTGGHGTPSPLPLHVHCAPKPAPLHVLLLPCYCSRCGGGRSSLCEACLDAAPSSATQPLPLPPHATHAGTPFPLPLTPRRCSALAASCACGAWPCLQSTPQPLAFPHWHSPPPLPFPAGLLGAP